MKDRALNTLHRAPEVLVEDEIDLRELVVRIWRRKWFILLFAVATFTLVLLYLNIATYRYTVDLKVAPVEGEGGSRMGALGELAGAVGMQLPGGGDVQKIDLYRALLQSQEVAQRLLQSDELMLGMFADDWDAEAGTWREPEPGAVGKAVRAVKAWLGLPREAWEPPSPRRVLTFLEDEVVVAVSRDSPIVTASLEHEDRDFGRALLMHLHREADAILRERTLARTSRYVDYLQTQLQRTAVAEYRTALVNALTAQEKLRMAAMADVPFSVDVVSGPVASAEPTSPRPVFLLALALVVGTTAAIMLVLVRDALRGRQTV